MQIYESETHLIGSEMRLNHQKNGQNLRYTLSLHGLKVYKTIEAQNLSNLEIIMNNAKPDHFSPSCFFERRKLWPKVVVDQVSYLA